MPINYRCTKEASLAPKWKVSAFMMYSCGRRGESRGERSKRHISPNITTKSSINEAILHSPLCGIWWWEMDDWGGYRGLKPPSLPPSPGSKPLSALMWKNSKNPSAWICSLGPQTPLTAYPLHLCGARCSFTPSVIMTLPHLRGACARVCIFVWVSVRPGWLCTPPAGLM